MLGIQRQNVGVLLSEYKLRQVLCKSGSPKCRWELGKRKYVSFKASRQGPKHPDTDSCLGSFFFQHVLAILDYPRSSSTVSAFYRVQLSGLQLSFERTMITPGFSDHHLKGFRDQQRKELSSVFLHNLLKQGAVWRGGGKQIVVL